MLLILLAVSLLSAALGLFYLLTPDQTRRRLENLSPRAAADKARRQASFIVALLEKFPATSDAGEEPKLKLKFVQAGLRHGDYRSVYYAARIILAVLFAGAVFIFLNRIGEGHSRLFSLSLVAAALLGGFLPNLLLNRAIRQRRREIFEAFPDTADLLLICMEAGLGLSAALDKVTHELRGTGALMADELHLCRLELRAGATLEQSLENLARRTGAEEVQSFASMLTQADALGVSIADSLRTFSDDLRHQRLTRAEEQAVKVGTKMLFPLVLCIFPSTLLVLLGPVILRVTRSIAPLLTGG
jgi:tight adherence protein C